ncbi:MAG: HAD family hydrolase [Calditrichaeota bacterium]|nr:MAG: HAD family hydrolase [Calditrichota bacterium]
MEGNSRKPAFDLLIFDLDGTLADTRADLAAAVNSMRRHFDLPELTVAQVTGMVGEGLEKLLERALPGAGEQERARARALFHQFYSRNLVHHTRLYPGIREVLEQTEGIDRAVLSNKPDAYTRTIVQRLGVAPYFRLVMGKRDDFPRKPDPTSLRYILNQLNCPAERALIIGDTKNDILAGQAAGVKTCAVTFGFRTAEQLKSYRPDYLIHSPLALLHIVFPAGAIRSNPSGGFFDLPEGD